MAGDRSLEVGPDVRSSRNTKPTQQLAPERVTAWPAGGADVAHSQVVKSEQSPCHGFFTSDGVLSAADDEGRRFVGGRCRRCLADACIVALLPTAARRSDCRVQNAVYLLLLYRPRIRTVST